VTELLSAQVISELGKHQKYLRITNCDLRISIVGGARVGRNTIFDFGNGAAAIEYLRVMPQVIPSSTLPKKGDF
jgi:hypothetical protein